jgi:hypothetical protein
MGSQDARSRKTGRQSRRRALEDRASAAAGRRSEAATPGYFARAEVFVMGTRTPLKEGLIQTIAYFEKLLSEGKMRDLLTKERSA